MSRVPLTTAEQRLLMLATPLRAILRPGFRGHAFRLSDVTLETPRAAVRFPEELVLGLIGRGLLTVNQCAKDLPDHAKPGTTYDVPFSCILSKAGVEQRSYLFADRRSIPANDTPQDHKTGEAA